MSTPYFVKLDHYEGPLDLLVHLIKGHELDILDVNLVALTTQYLNYLRLINFKDLQDASAFLQWAAILIELKAHELLPSTDSPASKTEVEKEDFNLQNRLILFETFSRAGLSLAERGQKIFGKTAASYEWERLEGVFSDVEAPLRGDSATLTVLYEQLLSHLSTHGKAQVTAVKESLTVDDVMVKIHEIINKLELVLFQSLLGTMNSRYELVAYILAILQMSRDLELKIHQEEFFGPLWVYGNNTDEKRLGAIYD